MVKTISFSAVEVLPSLLDKSKTQTIRPVWKINEEHLINCPTCMAIKKIGKSKVTPEMLASNPKIPESICNQTSSKYPLYIDKPPRFSVGDKARFYWKQRSKYNWFCKEHGTHIEAIITQKYPPKGNGSLEGGDIYGCTTYGCENQISGISLHASEYEDEWKNLCGFFNKLLREDKITEVFEIEMTKDGVYNDDLFIPSKENDEYIAKRDGFSNAEEMFAYFDKNYDLSSPKKFYVYRWK